MRVVNAQVRVELKKEIDVDELAKDWIALEDYCSANSFVSWHWIGSWLTTFKDKLPIYLLSISRDEKLIGLALFASERIYRRKVITSRMLTLNGACNYNFNMTIEHNAILLKPGGEVEAYAAIGNYFEHNFKYFDEWQFPLIDHSNYLESWNEKGGYRVVRQETMQSPFVNLNQFNSTNTQFIDSLSRNARSQIRSTIRKFSELGELKVIEPSSLDEAMNYFSALGELHQVRWTSKGLSGSFSNPLWVQFHKQIIKSGYEKDKIQILKVVAGETVIGYVYSLVKDGCVSMIQTGFDYTLRSNAKPGYLCHYLVIIFNLKKKMKKYDFLGGADQYKLTLATDVDELQTYVVQRNKFKFLFESKLLVVFRSLRRLLRMFVDK